MRCNAEKTQITTKFQEYGVKMERLIGHIRKKLADKGEILDEFDIPTDEQIKYIMLGTIEIVNEECQQCFYCENYKRFSFGSMCKIKPHIKDNCFHFTLDVNKVMKKKYYKIRLTIDECTRGKHIIYNFYLSTKTQKNIMYESIRLSESLKDFSIINSIEKRSDQ